MRHPSLRLAALALGLLACGCSLKRMAVNSVANSIAAGGDVYSRDDDPELIRDAVPFGLKTMESLLEVVPDNRNLLLAACQGYTQYAYAFVQLGADTIESTRYDEATRLHDRALKLFLRGRDFGLRALEVKHKGITRQLQSHPETAARPLTAKEVPLIFWTAASWGSAINLGKDRPDLAADIDAVKALITRGLALDERYERGAFHEAMILMESLPPAMGGSPERARQHFERAVALSQGTKPGPFVTLAQSVSVASQNRREFRELLAKALAVDPEKNPSDRLQTLLLQSKARALLAREDELFLDADTTSTEKSK
jgi:tetratricopeptide (TPR) repeat protein